MLQRTIQILVQGRIVGSPTHRQSLATEFLQELPELQSATLSKDKLLPRLAHIQYQISAV